MYEMWDVYKVIHRDTWKRDSKIWYLSSEDTEARVHTLFLLFLSQWQKSFPTELHAGMKQSNVFLGWLGLCCCQCPETRLSLYSSSCYSWLWPPEEVRWALGYCSCVLLGIFIIYKSSAINIPQQDHHQASSVACNLWRLWEPVWRVKRFIKSGFPFWPSPASYLN